MFLMQENQFYLHQMIIFLKIFNLKIYASGFFFNDKKEILTYNVISLLNRPIYLPKQIYKLDLTLPVTDHKSKEIIFYQSAVK